MKRPVQAVALVLGAIVVISLAALLPKRELASENWLRITGPAVDTGFRGAGDQGTQMCFTVSNAGPRTVSLLVSSVEWMEKDSEVRGYRDSAKPDRMFVPSGGTVVLPTTSSVATLPEPSEIVAYCSVSWWQEASAFRRLIDGLERRLPFGLWPRRPLARGTLNVWSPQEPSEEDVLRLRYGVVSRVAEPVAPHEPPPRTSVPDVPDNPTLDSLPAPGSSGGRITYICVGRETSSSI